MADVARCTECGQPLRVQPTPEQDLALASLLEDGEVETCLGPQVCPMCGEQCHDDASIENRNKCFDCHKRWQFDVDGAAPE